MGPEPERRGPIRSMDLFQPAAIITNGALWGRAFLPGRSDTSARRHIFRREWIALPGAEERIATEFGTVAMVVADEDMPDLPAINIVQTRLELPEAAMATYRAMSEALFAEIGERSIEAAPHWSRPASSPRSPTAFLYDEGADDPVPVHDRKLEWLAELVDSLDGEPLLIAYEFVEDLRAVRRAFGDVPALGGETSAKDAKRLVEAWNAGALPLLAFHPLLQVTD